MSNYAMKKRFSNEQIAAALKQVKHGTPLLAVIRKMAILGQTFYGWK
jgi:hypothetical protein